MKNYYHFLTIFFFCNIQLFAQVENNNDSICKKALNVFIDCNTCNMDYVKKQITFVDYVRDQKDAQLYVMITSQAAGSGGNEFSFFFIGKKEFSGKKDTLKLYTLADDSEDDTRKNQVKILKMGLMPYIAKTPFAKKISIEFESNEEDAITQDKWKSWVFEINGSAWLSGEESIKSTNIYSYFDATKVTEKLKINLNGSGSYYATDYKIDDTTNYLHISNSKNFNAMIVKSINNHWSFGANAYVNSSTFSNLKLAYAIFPAIEYNLYKYSESTRRQLRFFYDIGGIQRNYFDTTIFNKTHEFHYKHSFSIAYMVKETWGSINTSLYSSQYLHDLTKTNLNLYTSLSIRIFKGLSLSFYGNIALIHDQLNLQKAGATTEEILTQQKQLASQYSYYTSVGLTYTFGSIYNNVVNPRFGN